MICMKCHLPQLAEATDDVAKEIVKNAFIYTDPKSSDEEREKSVAKLSKVSINCLVCHQRNAIIHKWVDGFPEKDTVYGYKDGAHADSTYPKMKKSPIMSESILCGQCHGLGPNFELENPSQCGTLYGSYLWAYRAEGGQESCQECHMKKSKLGHNMQSYNDINMGKTAVDFQVETLGYHLARWLEDDAPDPCQDRDDQPRRPRHPRRLTNAQPAGPGSDRERFKRK